MNHPACPFPRAEASGVPMGASQGILLPIADVVLKDALFLHMNNLTEVEERREPFVAALGTMPRL